MIKTGAGAYTASVGSRPAVFIDRDGTLTDEVGYVNHPSRLRMLPRSPEAIRRLNEARIPAVVITNQAGVARGYFTEDLLRTVHAQLAARLAGEGARLDGIYACTHHPSEGEPPYRQRCECRKPKPGLLLQAAADLDLDLTRSVMVGDRPSDMAVGRSVGARGVLVLTGYGRGEWEYHRDQFSPPPDHVAEDLLEAVEWVLKA